MHPGTRNRPRGAAQDNSTSRQTRPPLKRQDDRRGGETWRVFIAAAPDERHLAQLSQLQRELRAHLGDAAARWTNAAGFHLTLRFVGDVTPADAEPLCEATSRACISVMPFQLHLANLGCFPNKRDPRVLWAGLKGDLQSLHALQLNVAGETADFGEPPEHRPYQPHFTLARIKDGRRVAHIVEHALNQMQDDVSQRDTQHHTQHQQEARAVLKASDLNAWMVREIRLIRSGLSPQGAQYQTLAAFPLTASAA